jgi:GTPase SAR1 family protein
MFKICVVGSGGVGKSSLTIQYLKNEFTEVCIVFLLKLKVDYLGGT